MKNKQTFLLAILFAAGTVMAIGSVRQHAPSSLRELISVSGGWCKIQPGSVCETPESVYEGSVFVPAGTVEN